MDGLRHLVLPVLTVSLILVAHVSRMVRSEMVDVLARDYMRAARMKGLSARPGRAAARAAQRAAAGGHGGGAGRRLPAGRHHRGGGDLRLPRDRAGADRGGADARPAVDPGGDADHGGDLRRGEPGRRHRLRAARPAHRTMRDAAADAARVARAARCWLLVGAVAAGPWLAPYDPEAFDPRARFAGPRPHWLGADQFGRDLLSAHADGGADDAASRRWGPPRWASRRARCWARCPPSRPAWDEAVMRSVDAADGGARPAVRAADRDRAGGEQGQRAARGRRSRSRPAWRASRAQRGAGGRGGRTTWPPRSPAARAGLDRAGGDAAQRGRPVVVEATIRVAFAVMLCATLASSGWARSRRPPTGG